MSALSDLVKYAQMGDVLYHGTPYTRATEAAAELARLRAIEQERDAWRKELQDLTPGGSEFTEPQECGRYVRDRLDTQWTAIKRMKQERDALREALRHAHYRDHQHSPHLCDMCKKVSAALKESK